jgi:type III restriction enzyme
MAMAIVWSYFHKKMIPGSDLSTNFLIVAPNVIVYQRLERDFQSSRIFEQLPLIPPEWKARWAQKVILRDNSAEPDPSGNLFLTNIHQLYESRERGWTPQNAIDALLGREPQKDLASQERSILERIRGLKDLVVLNNEAHHVHRADLEWSKSLHSLHEALSRGLALWLDFSATPRDQNGMYYPWAICDYPLAQSVEDRIVKAPLTVTLEDDPRYPGRDPENVTNANVIGKYGFWIEAAVKRWKDHYKVYKKLGIRPVLFIMAEKNTHADAIKKHLVETKEYGLRDSEVLIIRTNNTGEVSRGDLETARQHARDIDLPGNKIKAIVSVMMLREGWDVRNVSVCLGLRPFTAKAEILPEQVIGRGLRLMRGVGPDRTQTLEVLGTKNLLDTLRDKLEAEGVGVATTSSDQVMSIQIEPVGEKFRYDISFPITKPSLTHNVKKLDDLDPDTWAPIYDDTELDEPLRIKLKMDFAMTETEVHQDDLVMARLPLAQELISSITNKVMASAKIPNAFSQLYPVVRQFISNRCFGQPVDLESEIVRSHLQAVILQDRIARNLAQKISELIVERLVAEFEQRSHRLSETKPFSWRRNLQDGPLVCERTVFNYVATYNDFERRFAQFLNAARDVARFAALGTTQQGDSGANFRVDYVKPSGAIGFYHPDWVAVQKTTDDEVYWIIETKGRVWEDTAAKDEAMRRWCDLVSQQTGRPWRFARLNQTEFEARKPKTLTEIMTPKKTESLL